MFKKFLERIVKIHVGSTRVGVAVLRLFVVKFPRIYGSTSGYTFETMRLVWEKQGFRAVLKEELIGRFARRITQDILMGIATNVCEGWVYLQNKSPFLQPTFCFALFNIQPYAGEIIPTEDQMKPFFKSLPDKGRVYLSCISGHHYSPDNFRVVDGKLRLIDYGGKFYESASFPFFLISFKDELSKELSKPVA
jgi:hypothetical protein